MTWIGIAEFVTTTSVEHVVWTEHDPLTEPPGWLFLTWLTTFQIALVGHGQNEGARTGETRSTSNV